MVTSPVNVVNFRIREDGFRKSLAAPGTARRRRASSSPWTRRTRAPTGTSPRSSPPARLLPAGLFCCNDIVCLGVARALREAGRRVPGRCFAGRVRQPAGLRPQRPAAHHDPGVQPRDRVRGASPAEGADRESREALLQGDDRRRAGGTAERAGQDLSAGAAR